MFRRIRLLIIVPMAWLGFAATGFAREAGSPPAATPLDEAIVPETLWTTAPDSFVESRKELEFDWISSARDSAQSTLKGATFLGLPVSQTILRMRDGRIGQVTLLFFNRGDSGEIGKAEFDTLVRKAVEAITSATGVKFVPRGRDASSAVKAEGVIWNTEKTDYLLEYSFVKEMKSQGIPFRGEFIRLEMVPREKPKSILEEAQAAREKAAPFRGIDHVSRDAASGDVVIKDIPMVDQGEKGYCAVATAERVLRYYGIRVDAHELAQLANSSAEGGTDPSAMMESLKKLTARLRIRVRTINELSVKSLLALISDYNRAAKRAKEPGIPDPGNYLDVQEIYSRMKPDLLRDVRTRSKSALSGFERHIKTNIDKGVPLLWSVILGIMPEGERKQSVGGHMRLIIGYNSKSQEIVYSDSWGLNHEFKRMPMADAWSMTTGLATIDPL